MAKAADKNRARFGSVRSTTANRKPPPEKVRRFPAQVDWILTVPFAVVLGLESAFLSPLIGIGWFGVALIASVWLCFWFSSVIRGGGSQSGWHSLLP